MKTKSSSKFVYILIGIAIVIICVIVVQKFTKTADIILNVNDFIFDNEKTEDLYDKRAINEQELIAMLGQPDNIKKWDHEISDTKYYEIRSFVYGHVQYHFNALHLQRISINESINYEKKSDILQMFGLKEYDGSVVVQDDDKYIVTACGIREFSAKNNQNRNQISDINISFTTLFHQKD